jgi:hypothetical protein
MSAHRRRSLERFGRRMEQEVGGPLRVCSRGEDAEAVEQFLRLEGSGWKGEAGTAMSCRPEHAGFLREMAEGFRKEDRLDLLTLEGPQEAIAMKMSLLAGNGAFCFKSAYDERFARSSPGVRLEVEHVAQMRDERRIQWADSCTDPHNVMIDRIWSRGERRVLTTMMFIPRRRWSARLALSGLRGARALQHRVREVRS